MSQTISNNHLQTKSRKFIDLSVSRPKYLSYIQNLHIKPSNFTSNQFEISFITQSTISSQIYRQFIHENFAISSGAFFNHRKLISSVAAVAREEETKTEKSHTRKRERYFAVSSSSFTHQQSTRFAAEQTRKENIGEPHQSLTHTHTFTPSFTTALFVNCCFCWGSRWRNAFERNFSCFSFVLYLELFSRDFLPFQAQKNYTLTKHKSVEEEKKQIGKKFYFIHDKSSSYWIIESKRKKNYFCVVQTIKNWGFTTSED